LRLTEAWPAKSRDKETLTVSQAVMGMPASMALGLYEVAAGKRAESSAIEIDPNRHTQGGEMSWRNEHSGNGLAGFVSSLDKYT
jgi:hypothetical protein